MCYSVGVQLERPFDSVPNMMCCFVDVNLGPPPFESSSIMMCYSVDLKLGRSFDSVPNMMSYSVDVKLE